MPQENGLLEMEGSVENIVHHFGGGGTRNAEAALNIAQIHGPVFVIGDELDDPCVCAGEVFVFLFMGIRINIPAHGGIQHMQCMADGLFFVIVHCYHPFICFRGEKAPPYSRIESAPM